jgi:hypothetical protein
MRLRELALVWVAVVVVMTGIGCAELAIGKTQVESFVIDVETERPRR